MRAQSRNTRHRKSLSQSLLTLVTFGLFVYFAYHLVHGDRGYFALRGLEKKLVTAELKLEQKKDDRQKLENRVKRLRPNSLDLDMLDERARVTLGFMKPEEKVIIADTRE